MNERKEKHHHQIYKQNKYNKKPMEIKLIVASSR